MALADSVRRASEGGELERRGLDAQIGKIQNGRRIRLGTAELYLHTDELSGRPLHTAVGDRLRSFVRERVDVSLALLSVGRSIRFRPTSTLSAIYLDLAMEMVGNLGARLRECDYCHRPYRAGRRDSRFCSATCRSSARHYRSKTGSTINSSAPPDATPDEHPGTTFALDDRQPVAQLRATSNQGAHAPIKALTNPRY
jgi:hypothetical protein